MASALHFHLSQAGDGGNAEHRERQPMTLRIERSTRQRFTVFTLSGRTEGAQVPELKELFDCEYRNIILDLRDVSLADRDAVRFLRGCERDGMKFENCPAYVREWMDREKNLANERALQKGSGLREEVNRGGDYIFIDGRRYLRGYRSSSHDRAAVDSSR